MRWCCREQAQKDRQCTYVRKIEARCCNRCYSGPAISINYWVGGSPIYTGCNAHAPDCHLWPVRLYGVFAHYVVNATFFGKKKLLVMKCLFWFPLQLCLKHFSFLEELSEIWSKMLIGLIYSTLYCCLSLMGLEFSRLIFLKLSTGFYEYSSSGSRVPCGQTDVTNSRFSQFCESV